MLEFKQLAYILIRMKKSLPSPLNEPTIVYVNYGRRLGKIIGRQTETYSFREAICYEDFLLEFFTTHPKVFKKLFPGALSQKINGASAYPDHELFTGDCIELETYSLQELQNQLQTDIESVINKHNLPVSFTQMKNFIFKDKGEDPEGFFNSFLKPYEENFTTTVEFEHYMQLLWKAWNMFPHRELDNKTPVELFHKSVIKKQKNILNSDANN